MIYKILKLNRITIYTLKWNNCQKFYHFNVYMVTLVIHVALLVSLFLSKYVKITYLDNNTIEHNIWSLQWVQYL